MKSDNDAYSDNKSNEFPSNNLESLQNSLEEFQELNSNEEIQNLPINTILSPTSSIPPLTPSLKNLRRWLPRIEDDLPNAS